MRLWGPKCFAHVIQRPPKLSVTGPMGRHGYRYGGAINRLQERTTVITVIHRKVMTEYDYRVKGPLRKI